jgi:hypothetical protein
MHFVCFPCAIEAKFRLDATPPEQIARHSVLVRLRRESAPDCLSMTKAMAVPSASSAILFRYRGGQDSACGAMEKICAITTVSRFCPLAHLYHDEFGARELDDMGGTAASP